MMEGDIIWWFIWIGNIVLGCSICLNLFLILCVRIIRCIFLIFLLVDFVYLFDNIVKIRSIYVKDGYKL